MYGISDNSCIAPSMLNIYHEWIPPAYVLLAVSLLVKSTNMAEQSSRACLLCLIGLPGAGKTTFVRRFKEQRVAINRIFKRVIESLLILIICKKCSCSHHNNTVSQVSIQDKKEKKKITNNRSKQRYGLSSPLP